MSEIERLMRDYAAQIHLGYYETEAFGKVRTADAGQAERTVFAYVAIIEAQRDAAVAALKELYAQTEHVEDRRCNDGDGHWDIWQSRELGSALRKAKTIIDAGADAPTDSSSLCR